MSIYPDWIGVDVGTGTTILVDGYTVDFSDNEIDVVLSGEIEVTLENNEVDVEYGS